MDASSNSFERHRPWFIKRLFDGRAGVRAVFSGHIHRNGLFAVYQGGKHRGALADQYLIQALPPSAVAGAASPRPSTKPLPALENTHGVRYSTGPLYVNTTSAGPSSRSNRTVRPCWLGPLSGATRSPGVSGISGTWSSGVVRAVSPTGRRRGGGHARGRGMGHCRRPLGRTSLCAAQSLETCALLVSARPAVTAASDRSLPST